MVHKEKFARLFTLLFFNLIENTSCFCESYPSFSYYYYDCWDGWKNNDDVDEGFGVTISLLIGGFALVVVFVIFIVLCCVCYKQYHPDNRTLHRTHIGLSLINPVHTVSPSPHPNHVIPHPVSPHPNHVVPHPVSPHPVSPSGHQQPISGNHFTVATTSLPPPYHPYSIGPLPPAYHWYGRTITPSYGYQQPPFGEPPTTGQTSSTHGTVELQQQGNVGPPPVSS